MIVCRAEFTKNRAIFLHFLM